MEWITIILRYQVLRYSKVLFLKVFSLRKTTTQFFKCFRKSAKEVSKKATFLVYSVSLKVNYRWYKRLHTSQFFFLSLTPVAYIFSIMFLTLLFIQFFVFKFEFFFLLCLRQDIHSISLQPAFNLIAIFHTENFH